MTQPSLKIKLRLSSPHDSKVSTPTTSSTTSSQNSPKQIRSSSPTTEPSAKRSRIRSKKPTTTQPSNSNTVSSETPTTVILSEDQGTPNSNANRAPVQKSSPRIRAIFTHKDTPTRKWMKAPLRFYTLGGGQVDLPSGCWRSDEEMKLNKRTTEPSTLADIDQLFAVEKDFRPFLCTHVGCSKSFTSFDLLQTHETNMHGIKKMVCGIDGCQKSFATSGQLTKHRKMVHFRAARKAKKLAEAEASAAAEVSSPSNSATIEINVTGDDNDSHLNGDLATVDTPMTASSTQAMDEDSS